MKPRDLGLWIIIGAFLAWEFVCYFTHNQINHTLSWNLWHWAREHPWLRILYALAILLLFIHIVFGLPRRRRG